MVGSAILRNLQLKGYTDIISNYHKNFPTDESVEWVPLDLENQKEVNDFFAAKKPDIVFLGAAKVGGILANDTYRGEFIYQNLMIQTNVLHHAYLHGARRLLFLGSSCIYPRNAPQPMKEDCLMTGPLEQTNSPYATAKIAGVEMCDAYNKQYGTSYLPVMPTNLYGINDNFDLETSHVLPALIRKFHLAKLADHGKLQEIEVDEAVFGTIPETVRSDLGISGLSKTSRTQKKPVVRLWGTGAPRREFLYVDDLAEACIYLLLQTGETQLTNIGVGCDISIKELADLVQNIVGFDGNVVFDPDKPDGTPKKLLDVSRLQSLGWQARTSLEQGIRATYKWYKQATSL